MSSGQNELSGNFRILSLDGGGVRGILTARILAGVEDVLNHRDDVNTPLGKRFDLLVGTSTGGIIALALAMGRPASDIVEFYKLYIPKIFGKKNSESMPRLLNHPQYSAAALRNALHEFFRETTLEDVSTDVCIPAVVLQNAKPRMYKSGYIERHMGRLNEKLVDIALSTSAAPTFFQAHSSMHSSHLVDGGIVANNPSMIAIVEALQFEKDSKRGRPPLVNNGSTPLSNISMLSVGTGDQCAMPYKVNKLISGGKINWAMNLDKESTIFSPSPVLPLYEIMMHSQSQLVDSQAKHILNQGEYLRVNPQLKSAFKLDDAEKIDELKNLSDISADIEEFVCNNFV